VINIPGAKSIPERTQEKVLRAAKKFDYPRISTRATEQEADFTVGVVDAGNQQGYAALF